MINKFVCACGVTWDKGKHIMDLERDLAAATARVGELDQDISYVIGERDAARAEITELLACRDADALIIGQAGRDIERARAEATALREILEIFADDKSWEGPRDGPSIRVRDMARAALAAAAAVPEPAPTGGEHRCDLCGDWHGGEPASSLEIHCQQCGCEIEADITHECPPGFGEPAPVREMLFCPACGEPHIDEAEWATRPHKTHLCASCGHEWQPYPHPTVGIPHGLPDCTCTHPIVSHDKLGCSWRECECRAPWWRVKQVPAPDARDAELARMKTMVEGAVTWFHAMGRPDLANQLIAMRDAAPATPPAAPQPADPSHVHLCDYLDAIVAGRAKDCKHCNPSAATDCGGEKADPSAERAAGGG